MNLPPITIVPGRVVISGEVGNLVVPGFTCGGLAATCELDDDHWALTHTQTGLAILRDRSLADVLRIMSACQDIDVSGLRARKDPETIARNREIRDRMRAALRRQCPGTPT